MNKKRIIFIIFLIVAIAQIYVPASIVFDRQDILDNGIDYKFQTKPIDPSDPFRGNYVALDFEKDYFEVPDLNELNYGETVYVALSTDSIGFATLIRLSKNPFNDKTDYIKVRISNITTNSIEKGKKGKKVFFDYPFDRFYLEESNAEQAEKIYRKFSGKRIASTYAIISVKDGKAVIKDLVLDNKPIREYFK